jgi:transcriptional regulator with XRE-family HTH domain
MALQRDWQNLARLTRERREELGLTQEDVAKSGGPSTATIRLIESKGAQSYRPKTYHQLEAALQLRPGSVRSALNGGPFWPREAPPEPKDEIDDSLASSWDSIREWIEMMNELSPEEQEAERDRIQARLRQIRGEGEPGNGHRHAG